MDEDRLIAEILAGNQRAFSHIVTAYHRRLYYFVAGKLPGNDETEDIVQKTFVTAFKCLSEFRSEEPLYPWLRKIALNHCRNHWRLAERRARLRNEFLDLKRAELELGSSTDDDASDELREQRVVALRACLATLDDKERHALQLRFHEELPLDILAERMGKTAEAVRLFLFRVRKRLSRCVAKRLALGDVSS